MAKKEITPELRIVLAFALSFIILIVSQMLRPKSPAIPPDKAAKQQAVRKEAAKTPEAKAAETKLSLPSEPVAGSAEEEITVEGDLYKVVFSTRGAVIKSWTLKNYKDGKGNPLELVNSKSDPQYGDPMSIWVPEEAVRKEVNAALFAPSQKGSLQAPVTLTFEYGGEHIAARKQFVFTPSSYAIDVESDLATDGKPIAHQLAWRGTFGDIHDAGIRGTRWDVFYRQPDAKMVRVLAGKVEGESSDSSGQFAFAGIEDHFFVAAFIPPQDGLRVTAFKEEILLANQTKPTPSIGVAVGTGNSPANRLKVYVGPKQAGVLSAVQPNLPELIDYGWFAVVAKPLFYSLRWIHDHIVGNYGWAVVLLTIAINMLLFPLKITSLRSARKMQLIQPQLRAVQEKYKGMKMNDPRRQQMSQETMDLYKKHGVNPVGGCLPMLLQLPFLYGFYKVLLVSIEMRHAPWISWWVPDLSAAEPGLVGLKFLPLMMCGTQFALQRMSPAPSADPAQQKIMLFMPAMFLVFFWNVSSGLVLYWLTQNVVGIGQQWYINRSDLKHQIEEKRSGIEKKKRK